MPLANFCNSQTIFITRCGIEYTSPRKESNYHDGVIQLFP